MDLPNHSALFRRVMVRSIALLLMLAMLASSVRAAEPADDPKHDEKWYVIRFQGQHAGWVVERYDESAEQIETSSHMHMAIRRGPQTITIEVESSFSETPDGKPISAASKQTASQQSIMRTIDFKDGKMHIVTTQGDRRFEETQHTPDGPWLTPAASGRYIEEQINAGETKISFRSLTTENEIAVIENTMELLGKETIELYGRQVEAMKLAMERSDTPGLRMIGYTDDEGNQLRATIDFGGIAMEILSADKDLAQSELNPPELMASTLVKPSFELAEPRSMKQAKYRMSVPSGRMPDIGQTRVQKVNRIDEQSILVTIDLETDVAEEGEPPAVLHSAMIDGKDPRIIELVKNAVGDAKGSAQRAESMRRYVHRYIRQADLSVGMASASEVAATRTGDCTEHAVLLAAMLQADGIPARVASGLIYVDRFLGQDQIFGYHMWTQGYIDGKWVDLDATLPGAQPFDAAHILLSTTRLESGSGTSNDMVILAPLLGQLKIDLGE